MLVDLMLIIGFLPAEQRDVASGYAAGDPSGDPRGPFQVRLIEIFKSNPLNLTKYLNFLDFAEAFNI
jgi:hypothetical protein